MNNADDLRTYLRERGLSITHTSIVVDEMLADPVRRLAILNLIGDVREVEYAEWECESGRDRWTEWAVERGTKRIPRNTGVPVTTAYVLVPRGEAT